MEEIKVLSEQILTRTKKLGQSKLQEYQTVADEKIEATRQKLVESEKRQKETIVQKINNDYDRQTQTLKNMQRNQRLAKKQTLLNSIFDQAAIELELWDEATFSQFLSGVLKQIDQNKTWSLVPGERSLELIQSDQAKAVFSQYSFVKVSDRIVKNKAGFILEQGGIDYNFCFDVLINELKKDFSPQLAALAF